MDSQKPNLSSLFRAIDSKDSGKIHQILSENPDLLNYRVKKVIKVDNQWGKR